MGIIRPIKKWNLETNLWEQPTNENIGRSFCFAEYEDIINDKSTQKYHYIIIAEGSRVEDHTKKPPRIKDKEVNISRVIKYLKKQKYNYKIVLFLMDADAPIIEDAKLFAELIDKKASDSKCDSINLIGISKCGAMGFNIPSFFKNPDSFSKTNLYTIATPFEGTKLASQKILFKEVKDWVRGIFGKNKFSDFIADKLCSIQTNISSNSHMDFDIAIPDGVFEHQKSKYDSTFITNMFSNENLNAVSKLRKHINFETGIDKKTIWEAIFTLNFTGVGLCMINRIFFNKKSDGLVTIESQEAVTKYIPDIKRIKLKTAHHGVMTNKRLIKDIMNVVFQTIEEQIEIKNH